MSDSQHVTDHINALEPQFKEAIVFLRELFLSSGAEIAEHIKWNSPAFYYSGDMKTFNAKEYKRDLVVINLHRGKILLVFPTGNAIDPGIKLKGKNYPDGRKIVEIESLEDANSKAAALRLAVADWISKIER